MNEERKKEERKKRGMANSHAKKKQEQKSNTRFPAEKLIHTKGNKQYYPAMGEINVWAEGDNFPAINSNRKAVRKIDGESFCCLLFRYFFCSLTLNSRFVSFSLLLFFNDVPSPWSWMPPGKVRGGHSKTDR